MWDMMKLLNNIFVRDLELRYTKIFTIYFLLDTVVTTDCTCVVNVKLSPLPLFYVITHSLVGPFSIMII